MNVRWTPVVAGMLLFLPFSCVRRPADDGFGDGLIGQEHAEYASDRKSEVQPHAQAASAGAVEPVVPWENRKETSQPPVPDEDTEDRVREMFAELAAGNPDGVARWMVPIDLFLRIKDMHMPTAAQNERSARELHASLLRESRVRAGRFLARGNARQASFESMEIGDCAFVPVGRDFNRIAYWECRKNRIFYHVEGERKSLVVRRIVNWGRTWHLLEW